MSDMLPPATAMYCVFGVFALHSEPLFTSCCLGTQITVLSAGTPGVVGAKQIGCSDQNVVFMRKDVL